MWKLLCFVYILILISNQTAGRNGRRKGTPRPDVAVESWTGKWFPFDSTVEKVDDVTTTKSSSATITQQCDDGIHSLDIDFEPSNQTHSYNYLCLGNRTLYTPNMQREAIIVEHFIPPAYVAPTVCLNESIKYDEALPTFGAHRLLAPKYGEYKYLPPQRWLQSLADGAIVLLYHPCSFPGQRLALQDTLKGCMYRHIITPSQLLSPERPFALLAWGKCLQMSVIDDNIVVDFIKQNAKRGAHYKQNEVRPSKQSYSAALIAEAHLVSDEEDIEICGYKNM